MAQLLTKGIREALRDAAALDKGTPKRGESPIRLKAIDAIIGHAKVVHPEMFRDDVVDEKPKTVAGTSSKVFDALKSRAKKAAV